MVSTGIFLEGKKTYLLQYILPLISVMSSIQTVLCYSLNTVISTGNIGNEAKDANALKKINRERKNDNFSINI